jgi:hypothetical protein
MQQRTRVGVLIVVFALAVAACSGDDGEGTTTSAVGDPVTTLATAETSDGGSGDDASAAGTTTTTAAPGDSENDDPLVPSFSIVSREEGDEGDTVVVLIDPESYDTLTDIDLLNVVSEVVDEFPPVYEAHVVNSPDVAELVIAAPADVDAEGRRLMDLHYLVRLEEGFRIVYVGPFEDTATAILGS